MNRPIIGYVLAFLAIAMLVLVFGEVWAPLTNTTFGERVVPSGDRAAVGTIQPNSAAYKAGVRRGDTIDVMGMSTGDRLRLQTKQSPPGTRIAVPVIRNRERQSVIFVSQPRQNRNPAAYWPLLVDGFITLLIVAVIAWRKPSTATAALVLYGMGACTTGAVVGQLSWLADPWYAIVAVFVITAFSGLPIAAAAAVYREIPARAGCA